MRIKDFVEKNINDNLEYAVLKNWHQPTPEQQKFKEFYNEYAYIPRNWHHITHCMMIKNTIYDEFLNLYSKTFNEFLKKISCLQLLKKHKEK